MARVFVQTAKSQLPELDRWKQVGEDEARMVYEMTLRNELSGSPRKLTDASKYIDLTWYEKATGRK